MTFTFQAHSQDISVLIGGLTESQELRNVAKAFTENDRNVRLVQHQKAPQAQPGPELKIFGDQLTSKEKSTIEANYKAGLTEIKKSNPALYELFTKNTNKVVILPQRLIPTVIAELARQSGLSYVPQGTGALVGFTATSKDEAGKIRYSVFLSAEQCATKAGALMVINHEARHEDLINKYKSNLTKLPNSNEREKYAYSHTITDLQNIEKRWKKEGKPAADIKAIESAIADQRNHLKDYK